MIILWGTEALGYEVLVMGFREAMWECWVFSSLCRHSKAETRAHKEGNIDTNSGPRPDPHCTLTRIVKTPRLWTSHPLRVIQTHFAASNNVGAVAAKEEVWEVFGQLAGYAASLALLKGLQFTG